ncbi:MAG TPA: hypothetical protein VGG71_12585 [Chitinophagaceae bacterium]
MYAQDKTDFDFNSPFLFHSNFIWQKKVSEADIRELEAAETKMFDAVLKYDLVYWKDNVYQCRWGYANERTNFGGFFQEKFVCGCEL